jgi:hypothetical protein
LPASRFGSGTSKRDQLRALFHKRHDVGVLVGARSEPKRRGKPAERIPFREETRRRLTKHYRGLQHSSGTLEKTTLLEHNVLAIRVHDGIPLGFLDELRAEVEPSVQSDA